MGEYKVSFKKTAFKELHSLPNKAVTKIVSLIGDLSKEPRPRSCKKLRGYANLWRIRSGNYRVIYKIEDHVLIVEILKIVDRKNAY